MKTLRILCLSAAIPLIALISCDSHVTADESIDVARSAIAAGDFNLAVSTLDRFAAQSVASASDLSEIAVLYMIVNDHFPDGNNDLKAIECYRRAMQIAPDSVNAIFGELPPDEAQYLFMLQSLCGSIDRAVGGDIVFADDSQEISDDISEEHLQ